MTLPMDMHLYRKHGTILTDEQLAEIRRTSLGPIAGFEVFAVDGERVRNRWDINFVSGGNPARYRYCPERELWVEHNLVATDLCGVVLHEFVETILMIEQRMNYDVAHDHASDAEMVLRHAIDAGLARKIRTRRDAVKVAEEWFETRVLEASAKPAKKALR